MKINLTRAQIRSVTLRTMQAQRLIPRFERILLKQRSDEVVRVLNLLKGHRLEQMSDIAYEAFNEPYLNGIYEKLYVNVGVSTARLATNDFLSRKSAYDDPNTWQYVMQQYIDQYAGAKISIVEGSMKEFMRDKVRNALTEFDMMGIEQQTQAVYDSVLGSWNNAKPWMVRRIMQTEGLIALAVGQYGSMMQLGIPFNKTWSITGRNTRPQHELMHGVTVAYDQLFIMPNGDKMLHPHDEMNGAGADNIVNCCCGTFDTPI